MIVILLAVVGVLIAALIWLWRLLQQARRSAHPLPPAQPHSPPASDTTRLLHALIDTSPNAMFLIDRRGAYVVSNRAHYTSLGVSCMEEVVGKTIRDFFPPKVAQYIEEEDAIVRQTKAPLRVEVPDPRPLETPRWLQVIKTPILDEHGEVDLICAVVYDITDMRQTRDNLQHRISQMQLLSQIDQEVSSTLDLRRVTMFALDMLMRISLADAGLIAILQPEREELEIMSVLGPYTSCTVGSMISPYTGVMGRAISDQQAIRLLDVTADPDYDCLIPSTKALIALPLVSQEQLVGVIRLETARPERFSDNFFQFAQLVAARIATAIDNAKLYAVVRQKLEEVSRLEQLKTDMIRIASHDLKNPLAIVEGYLMMLDMSNYDLPTEVKDMLASMQRSVGRMNRILQDILSLERIQARAKGAQQVFNLADTVSSAVSESREQAERKGQTFEYTVSCSSAAVLGDEAQLHEAIANLISNAIKYTPEGGQICVTLDAADGRVIFKVIDNGFGIPEEMQKRLFEPFYRARTDETQGIEGTGLGLYLVKNIVERHNGAMIFHSVYGQGSTFGFRLPLHSAHLFVS